MYSKVLLRALSAIVSFDDLAFLSDFAQCAFMICQDTDFCCSVADNKYSRFKTKNKNTQEAEFNTSKEHKMVLFSFSCLQVRLQCYACQGKDLPVDVMEKI